MRVTPIKTDADYEAALEKIDVLWDAAADTPQGDELEILVTLVEVYEDKHHLILPPDPIEAIKVAMEEKELTYKDVAPYFGGKNRVSEVLNRKRKLTLNMIRALHKALDIPLEVLIGAEEESSVA